MMDRRPDEENMEQVSEEIEKGTEDMPNEGDAKKDDQAGMRPTGSGGSAPPQR
jgi:hypothetical protein